MKKFKKFYEGDIRMISESFQVEITINICLLLPVSLMFLPYRSYVVSKVRYCKKSGPGKWIGNCCLDLDGSHTKSQIMRVRSSFCCTAII